MSVDSRASGSGALKLISTRYQRGVGICLAVKDVGFCRQMRGTSEELTKADNASRLFAILTSYFVIVHLSPLDYRDNTEAYRKSVINLVSSVPLLRAMSPLIGQLGIPITILPAFFLVFVQYFLQDAAITHDLYPLAFRMLHYGGRLTRH